MSYDLASIVSRALRFAVEAAPEYVRVCTYVQPVGYNFAVHQTLLTESTATVSAVVLEIRPRELDLVTTQPGDENLLIAAADLGFIQCLPGDYLVEDATGLRRDVLSARLHDCAVLWRLQTHRSPNEDWGNLDPAGVSEDRGDLATATVLEDWGTLL